MFRAVYNRRGEAVYCCVKTVRILRDIILASASPRRRELLSSIGFRIRVVPSRYEERAAEVPPRALAVRHARGKALEADLTGLPPELSAGPGLIVGADTVVDVDGTALGKPLDRADARAMLRLLSGRAHLVHTAFCLRTLDGRLCERVETAAVRFFALDDAEIEAYVASGDGADKAGSYGIQGPGATLVERIDGDFYTVMGFPLASFVRSLPELGWSFSLAAVATAGAA